MSRKVFKMNVSEAVLATRECTIIVCVEESKSVEDAKALALDVLRRGDEEDWTNYPEFVVAHDIEPGQVVQLEDWDTVPESPSGPIEVDEVVVLEPKGDGWLSIEASAA